MNKAAIIKVQNDAIGWLTLLGSSRLTKEKEQEFFVWLGQSPLHQAAYLEVEQLWRRGEALEKVKIVGSKHNWQVNSWQGWALTSSFLVAVCWSLFSFMGQDTRNYHFQTVKGEQSELQLEDGSHIVLNTNSEIDVSFDGAQRLVVLRRGEVFFDVKKDKRPFDVVTQVGQVRVMGTHFAVHALAEDVQVTVIEGRVALAENVSAIESFVPRVILQADQRLTIKEAMAGAAPQAVDARSDLAWRKKQLVFKGQPLDVVVKELNRYLPRRLNLANSELGALEVTAVIQLQDPESSLATLAQSLGLTLAVADNLAELSLQK
jgi:transmembrane sensor